MNQIRVETKSKINYELGIFLAALDFAVSAGNILDQYKNFAALILNKT
jgi:hypothetical protein